MRFIYRAIQYPVCLSFDEKHASIGGCFPLFQTCSGSTHGTYPWPFRLHVWGMVSQPGMTFRALNRCPFVPFQGRSSSDCDPSWATPPLRCQRSIRKSYDSHSSLPLIACRNLRRTWSFHGGYWLSFLPARTHSHGLETTTDLRVRGRSSFWVSMWSPPMVNLFWASGHDLQSSREPRAWRMSSKK